MAKNEFEASTIEHRASQKAVEQGRDHGRDDPRQPAQGALDLEAERSVRGWLRRWRGLLRMAASLLFVTITAISVLIIWRVYVLAPWTRDGRVRVQVADVAPQISGQITELNVVDNQYVHKGDVLYVIDPFDYRTALMAASFEVKRRAADLQVKHREAERRLRLNDLATTAEEQQIYAGQATEAEGDYEIARQQEAQAEINLMRTEVRSPVNGFITNLLMRVGDYAHTGVPNIYVIDTESYWIDGYFEETKLASLCIGDRVEARLLGFKSPIIGRIETVTRGISVQDAAPSIQGLPNVDAVYTWVRLAQRVPVRIRITHVPSGVPLIAGLTATVFDRGQPSGADGQARVSFVDRAIAIAGSLFNPPARSANCIPPAIGASGSPATIPALTVPVEASPSQINPGLAPGLNASPTSP
jgi:multidrug resistance efflux pump